MTIVFRQTLNCFSSDETRIHYIEEAVNQAFATFGKRKAPKGAMKRGGRRSPDGSPGPGDGGGAMSGAVGGAMSGAVGGAVSGAVGGASDANQLDDYNSEAYVNASYVLLLVN